MANHTGASGVGDALAVTVGAVSVGDSAGAAEEQAEVTRAIAVAITSSGDVVFMSPSW